MESRASVPCVPQPRSRWMRWGRVSCVVHGEFWEVCQAPIVLDARAALAQVEHALALLDAERSPTRETAPSQEG